MLETGRLYLRELSVKDAAFILELVNEPLWLRFIGDRGIRTQEGALEYLLQGPLAMYRQHGFGLWRVSLRETDAPIGICGLIQRPTLEDVDLGFAFLSAYARQGYALEAAAGTLQYAWEKLGLRRVVAITSPDNDPSGRLLAKLGFRFERMARLSAGAPEVQLYSTQREGGLSEPVLGCLASRRCRKSCPPKSQGRLGEPSLL